MNDVKDTIVRADDSGQSASVECSEDGTQATATWVLEPGQLLGNADAPEELGTGGYVYFTLDARPTDVIKEVEGGEAIDFSGAMLNGGEVDISLSQIEPGVDYRAHILLGYEDGPHIHNDTVFACEVETTTTVAQPTTTDTPDTLPFTGAAHVDWMLPIALALVASGAAILGFTKRLFGGNE